MSRLECGLVPFSSHGSVHLSALSLSYTIDREISVVVGFSYHFPLVGTVKFSESASLNPSSLSQSFNKSVGGVGKISITVGFNDATGKLSISFHAPILGGKSEDIQILPANAFGLLKTGVPLDFLLNEIYDPFGSVPCFSDYLKAKEHMTHDLQNLIQSNGAYVLEIEKWLLSCDMNKLQAVSKLYKPDFIKIFNEVVNNKDVQALLPNLSTNLGLKTNETEGLMSALENGESDAHKAFETLLEIMLALDVCVGVPEAAIEGIGAIIVALGLAICGTEVGIPVGIAVIIFGVLFDLTVFTSIFMVPDIAMGLLTLIAKVGMIWTSGEMSGITPKRDNRIGWESHMVMT